MNCAQLAIGETHLRIPKATTLKKIKAELAFKPNTFFFKQKSTTCAKPAQKAAGLAAFGDSKVESSGIPEDENWTKWRMVNGGWF